jgi:hypothetical protein
MGEGDQVLRRQGGVIPGISSATTGLKSRALEAFLFDLNPLALPVMLNHLSESWPGLSRPSTSFWLKARKKDVDARDKRGHDGGEVIRSRRNPSLSRTRLPPRQRRGDLARAIDEELRYRADGPVFQSNDGD